MILVAAAVAVVAVPTLPLKIRCNYLSDDIFDDELWKNPVVDLDSNGHRSLSSSSHHAKLSLLERFNLHNLRHVTS